MKHIPARKSWFSAILRWFFPLLAVVTAVGCASLPPLTDMAPPRSLAGESSRFIDIDGTSIHYRVTNEQAEGIPILLLHGFMSNLHTWDAITPHLPETSPVYAYDRLAFGLSERPMPEEFQENGSPYRTEAVRNRAVMLMDSWGIDEAVLIGNSAGGNLAVQLALAVPERVLALILIDPAIYRNGPPAFARLLLRLPFLERVGLRNVRRLAENPENLLASAWHDPSKLTGELISHYTRPLKTENWDRALWEFTKASSDPGIVPYLKDIGVPVLIIHGEHDTIVPLKESERLVKAIPDAVLAVMPDCGHVPQEECPDAAVRLINDFFEDRRLILPLQN